MRSAEGANAFPKGSLSGGNRGRIGGERRKVRLALEEEPVLGADDTLGVGAQFKGKVVWARGASHDTMSGERTIEEWRGYLVT